MSRLMVCTRKGLFVYSFISGRWQVESRHFLGDPVTSFCVDAQGDWFAALNLGHFGPKLKRSSDAGTTWTDVFTPGFPEKPKNTTDKTDWAVKQIWTLSAHPQHPGRLYAGTIPGALFETKDAGESWQLNEALWQVPERSGWMGGGYDDSGVHSIAIDVQNPDKLTVAVSVGGVWHSDDAGMTWSLGCQGMSAEYMPPDMAGSEAHQDPHLLVQSPTKPDRMWVQHHCGIYVSDDHGRQWREAKHEGRRSFGFTVAVHPQDPDTAWFVPAIKDESRYPIEAALTVLKTTDGGQTFEELRHGLPQQDCFDLIYRHALAVNSNGGTLVMGSTTGNLWCSSDGGDQWQTVSSTMPPIYAVFLAE